MTVSLIIPAAGVGERFSKTVKKQFYLIEGKPILYFTLKKMLSLYDFSELIVGINENDKPILNEILESIECSIPVLYASGGAERVNTVANCLEKASSELVAVHDAVRPFITGDMVKNVINAASEHGAAIPALKIRDTVKYVKDNISVNTLDRNTLFLAHTPQCFSRSLLNKAFSYIFQHNISVTDEASAVELLGKPVYIILSNSDNIKITYAEDIDIIHILKNKYFD